MYARAALENAAPRFKYCEISTKIMRESSKDEVCDWEDSVGSDNGHGLPQLVCLVPPLLVHFGHGGSHGAHDKEGGDHDGARLQRVAEDEICDFDLNFELTLLTFDCFGPSPKTSGP